MAWRATVSPSLVRGVSEGQLGLDVGAKTLQNGSKIQLKLPALPNVRSPKVVRAI